MHKMYMYWFTVLLEKKLYKSFEVRDDRKIPYFLKLTTYCDNVLIIYN